MSYNPYAPPEVAVEAAPGADATAPLFFPVTPFKLGVMSVCTLGLYQVYWFYMNWRLVRMRDRSTLWPVPRALFGVFFCYALFARIGRDGAARSIAGAPAMGWLAALWIVLTIAWRLPDPAWLVAMFSFVALLPVQAYANRVNAAAAPRHEPNRGFTALNWVAIVAGGSLWLLAIVGMFASAGAALDH